ncbi:MAG: trehalose-6-phosphate synthase [Actinomycetia bacterium]|nr:trehalose-6-phosphate synthase [Actinomycetes bacterium]
MATEPTKRLIVVSNRLPYVLESHARDKWTLRPGSGGLVTALLPVLRDRGGIWIGWSGTTEEVPGIDEIFRGASREAGYVLKPVSLTQEEVDRYYHGYSNESVWPLFHDLQSRCDFEPEYWHTYVKVNRRFADALAEDCGPDDFVWVHDYQLMDVAHHVRERGDSADLAFFLHIPFPAPDIFMKLPERNAVLTSLLAYDLVGFQTQRDRRNFIQCVRTLVKHARVRVEGHLHVVRIGEREMRVGNFPIGIDADAFARSAIAPEVEERLRSVRASYAGRQIVLGLDRLDYTKGIPQRLRAFADLLERFPEVRGRIHLVQVVVPSREGIPEYDALRVEIERLVGGINGRYAELGWVPIHYLYRSLSQTELLAFYRSADIALITPLKDGMNLVAKEFCASNVEENSVLILSQFAGAAAQLGQAALVVNPYDVEETADAIYNAFCMNQGERRYRMRTLRRNVRTQNVFWWVDSFMRAAIDKELHDFPVLEEYIPEHHEGR